MYNGTNYVVQPGDDLNDIARRAYRLPPDATGAHHVAAQAIYNANTDKISDPKNLTPNTTIYLPTLQR